jgi:hypothetical protein
MPLLIIAALYFLIVSFFSGQTGALYENSLFSYYGLQTQFVLDNLLFFILGGGALILLLFLSGRTSKSKSFFGVLQKLITVTLLASLVSYIILFVIALTQLNFMSLVMRVSPKMLGVESDMETVVSKLKKDTSPPAIVVGQDNYLISAIATAEVGKKSFYGTNVIPTVSRFLVLPAKKLDEGVVLVGDTIIVININSQEFQMVSPVVAYLMIKDYFPRQEIKSYPKVELMSREEYVAFRRGDFGEKLKTFDEVISQIEEGSIVLTQSIEEEKNNLQGNEDDLEAAREQSEEEYINCVNEGYYEDGVYVKVNTKDDCRRQMDERAASMDGIAADNRNLERILADDQERLRQYEAYLEFYKSQKLLMQEESNYTSYEFATFSPPNTIKIASTKSNDPQTVADYLELLVHEYLHYINYENGRSGFSSAFFTEGLTEYFARNIIKKYLGVDTNLGYPVNVKLVRQMNKRILEADLADIYFSEDQAGLVKELNMVYGEDFFKNNQLLFETIHFSSDTDEIVRLANEVMKDMEGEPITKDDVMTTYSTFQ